MVARMMIILAALGSFGSHAYSQTITAPDVSRCGEGPVTLHASVDGGSGGGAIVWYDVPYNGAALYTGSDYLTGTLQENAYYYVDYVVGGIGVCPRKQVKVTISGNSMQAVIFYSSGTFCNSNSTLQTVTRTGTAGGVYSYTSSPLGNHMSDFNTVTGSFTPSACDIAVYTVTYHITNPAPDCIENDATTVVTVTSATVAPTISYALSPFCTTVSSGACTLTNGTTGGVFSATPSGLNFTSTSNGTIQPSASAGGTYTVTYFIPGTGGCSSQSATTSVVVTQLPTASISYEGAPFCQSINTSQAISLSGTGAYTGGSYTYTNGTSQTGLSPFTAGAVNPSLSTAGSYTVTYTAPASAGCAAVETNTSLSIYPLPGASISGTTSVCQNVAAPDITFTGTGGTAPYTFSYNVNGGIEQDITTTGVNTSITVAQSTVSAGTFTYTLGNVTDAHGCSFTISSSNTATITVTATPVADFVYTGTEFCKTGTVLPTFTNGGSAGTFSGTGVTFISTSTGEVDLAATPAGTYTVRNTLSACGGVYYESSLVVKALPTATITGTLTACVTTTLTAVTNATTPNYIWYKGTDILLGENAATLDITESGAYKVKVTDMATGCDFTSAASTVTIHPLPVVSITGTSDACVSTILTATNDASSPSFVWYKDNTEIPSETSVTLTATTSGDYKVKVTDGVTGCTFTTAALTVIIYPQPNGAIAGTTTVCVGATSPNITFTGSLGTSPYTFTYHINSGTDQTITTAPGGNSVDLPAPTGTTGTYVYYVTKVADGSIQACEKTLTGSATITVNPLPEASASGSQTICSNATATVGAGEATAANGTILWTENGAGSITAGATTLTPTYTAAIGDAGNTVTLTMTVTTSYASCSSATASGTYTVNVNPLPTASAGGSQAICSNATATVSGASASNGTIMWTENGAGSITAGATTLTPTYTAAAGDAGNAVTLTMTVTSTVACSTPITATATYTVNVNPLPTASAGGSQTICSNATATVSGASATNGTILWTHNGAGSITAGETTLTPTYTAAAGDAGNTVTLTMTVTSTVACATPITATATYAVTVSPLPTASAGGTQTICSGITATVSGATSSNGTILWTHNGNGSLSGATGLTPTYASTLADAGSTVTLTMTVTSNNACAPQTAGATYTVIVEPIPATLYVKSTYTPATPGWMCSKFATLESAFAASYASSSGNLVILEDNLTLATGSISIPASDQLEVSAGVNLTIPSGATIVIPQTGGLRNFGTVTIQNGGTTTSAQVSGLNNYTPGKTIVNAGGTVIDFGLEYVGAAGFINPTAGSLELLEAGMIVPVGSEVSILKTGFGISSGWVFAINGVLTNNAGCTTSIAGTLNVAQTTGRINDYGHIGIGGGTENLIHVEGTWAGELPSGSGTLEFTATSTVEVANLTELNAALAMVQVPNVKMVADISTPAMVAISLGKNLDGNGKTLTLTSPIAIALMQISDQPASIGTVLIKDLTFDANNMVNNGFQAFKALNEIILINNTYKNALHTGLMVNRSPNVTVNGLTGIGNGYYDIFAKAPNAFNTSLTATGIPCTTRLFKANPGSGMTVTVSLNGTLMPATGGTELATANGIQEGGTPGYTQWPSFDAQAGAGPFCENTSVTYTTQTGATNYIWSVPGTSGVDYSITSGGIGTSSNTVTLTWLTAGSKTVTILYTKYGCTAGTATSSTATTINALPAALTLTGSTICTTPGGNGTITSSTSVIGIDYQLYTSGNAAVQVPQAGTGTGLNWSGLTAGTGYYVKGTNSSSSCVSAVSNSVNVGTYTNPIALVLTGSTICTSPGGNGTITSSTSVSGVTYQLYNSSDVTVGGTKAGSGSGLTWSSLSAGTGYYVKGTDDAHSCVSPASNAVDVSTYTNPIALVLTGSTICVSPGGDGTIMSTASVVGVGYQLFNSSNGSVQTAKSGTGAGLTWSGLAAGTGYYVIGIDGNSCASPSSNAVDVATNANPTISTTGTAAAVTTSLSQQTTTLAYTETTNTPTSYSIDWATLTDQTSTSFAFASGGGSVTGIIIPAGTAANTYTGTMTIVNANGCTATQAVSVSVNPGNPTAPTPQNFCGGN